MSALTQQMIAAPAGTRTMTAFLAGIRPAFAESDGGQSVTWTLGDTAVPDQTFHSVEQELGARLDRQSREKVLRITAGNSAIALEHPESLPFRSSAFDVVTSTFGAMFLPDHLRTAREMLRVCRRGGRIGLACWIPDGFNGRLLARVSRYLPAGQALMNPLAWGTREYLNDLFGHAADALGARERVHTWRYASPEAWLDEWCRHDGPLAAVFRAVDPDWREQLAADLLSLARRHNSARDGSLTVHSEYLEFLVHKSAWRN